MAYVLVIEDRPSIGMVFNEALSGEGHEVAVVSDGKTGLERLARSPIPDIVLVDLLMPGGMTGKDVVAKIQMDSRLRNIPIVIISGCVPTPEVMPPEGTYKAFISKPFDIFDVINTVDKLTAKRIYTCPAHKMHAHQQV